MLRINIDVYGGIAHFNSANWNSEEEDCPIGSNQLEILIRDIEDEKERHNSKTLVSDIKINRKRTK
jgi:hypothetical protein